MPCFLLLAAGYGAESLRESFVMVRGSLGPSRARSGTPAAGCGACRDGARSVLAGACWPPAGHRGAAPARRPGPARRVRLPGPPRALRVPPVCHQPSDLPDNLGVTFLLHLLGRSRHLLVNLLLQQSHCYRLNYQIWVDSSLILHNALVVAANH